MLNFRNAFKRAFQPQDGDGERDLTLDGLQGEAGRLGSQMTGLMLDVDRVAASVYLGAHGRRRPGTGERFWQFRDYAPGEATTAIDWRQSAKRDGTYVREMEWEAGQTTLFWIDSNPSMNFSSNTETLHTKRERALIVGLALSRLLVRGGEFVGAGTGQARASGGKNAVNSLAEALLGRPQDAPPKTPPPRNAHGLWFTDGLTDFDTLEGGLALQRAKRTKGLLVQMADPTEIDFPFKGRVRFIGTGAQAEDGAETTIDRSEGVRDGYLTKMAAHRERLSEAARLTGWRFMTLSTGDSPEANLADLVAALGVKR